MLRRRRGCDHQHDQHHHAVAEAGVIDPVCGMTVDPETSKNRSDYRGVTYNFCSADCRTGSPPLQSNTLRRRTQPAARRRAGGHRLHLPNASADPPDRTRILPDLRNGAGARSGEPGGPTQPRPAASGWARAGSASHCAVVLVLLGQVLELRAREATSGAIKALLDLAPKTARLIHRRTLVPG